MKQECLKFLMVLLVHQERMEVNYLLNAFKSLKDTLIIELEVKKKNYCPLPEGERSLIDDYCSMINNLFLTLFNFLLFSVVPCDQVYCLYHYSVEIIYINSCHFYMAL